MGHAVTENRHGLVVNACVTEANGTAERSAALEMLNEQAGSVRRTIGADKAYDTHAFVEQLRKLDVTPHIAQNVERSGGSSIDARTTRHTGYRLSLKSRKMIEEAGALAKVSPILLARSSPPLT